MILAKENTLELCPFFISKNEVIFIGKIKSSSKNMLSVLELNYLNCVRDDVIVRNDGVNLNVLRVEPINFNLKTKVEQNNIFESYKFFLKQCNFNFQIYVQTQKIDMHKHIEEIKKCAEYESEIADMASDYIDLIEELAESKNSISRKFYIVYEEKENDSRSLMLQENLKLCGNVVTRCNKNEILKLFNSCFKNNYLA